MFRPALRSTTILARNVAARAGRDALTKRPFSRSIPALVKLKKDNPSFVLHGIEEVQYDERPIPKIKNDEVLVEVARTGICGSDVHYFDHGRIGDFVLREPMCLGHESSGVVVQLGPNVRSDTGLKVGSRVAMEPGVSCRTCGACKSGAYELCQHMAFAATPPSIYGTLARYYVIPADLAHLIPDALSFEDGAMIEPLAVGVHSVSSLGQIKSNATVVIFGAGPIGLVCMAVARALGARRVVAVDVNEDRLKFAKSYSASDIYKPSVKKDGESGDDYSARAASELREQLGIPALGPGAVDLTVDCTGAPSCIQMSMHLTKPSGTVVAVGMGSNMNIAVPFFPLMTKQLAVKGSFRYGHGDYQLAISLVERGLIDLKPLCTQRYEFTDALAAFEATKKGKDANGKPVIKCIISGPK